MYFVITIHAHESITTFTPLYFTSCATRIAWRQPYCTFLSSVSIIPIFMTLALRTIFLLTGTY